MADREEFSFGIEDDFSLENPEILDDEFYEETPKKTEPKKVDHKDPPKTTPKKTVQTQQEEDDEDLVEDELEEEDEVEEDEEEENKGEEDTEDEDEDNEESPEISWEALSKDLFKMGIFNLDEDEDEPEIKSPQDLKERFILESKKNAGDMLERFISAKGEEAEKAFQAIFINGMNPREYYGATNEISSIKELDISKPDNQKYITRKALKAQGWEDEDIEAEIERLETYADLEPAALRHQKALVKKEEADLLVKQEKAAERLKAEKERKQKFLSNVDTTLQEKILNKEFDGIPVSREFAVKTKDFITTEKYKLPDGTMITEWDKMVLDLKRPENHQKLVKIAMIAQMLDTDPTLSTIKRKVNTDKVNEEFSELAKSGKVFKKKPGDKPAVKKPFI